MKVEICKSVEIETEVEVSIDDFIGELQHKLQEIPEGVDRRESANYFIATLSISIQIIKAIPDEMIRQMPRNTLRALNAHLKFETERWALQYSQLTESQDA